MERRLRAFLSVDEYPLLLQAIQYMAQIFPDIIGVLGVGSLVQPPITPDNFFTPQYDTARGRAYEQIRNPGRRRLSIQESSDLDIWVCTKDNANSHTAQEEVELTAIAFMQGLAEDCGRCSNLFHH